MYSFIGALPSAIAIHSQELAEAFDEETAEVLLTPPNPETQAV